MTRWTLAAAAALTLALAPQARAQTSGCAKDTDCKGDRICQDGRCVSPPAAQPTPAATSVQVPRPAAPLPARAGVPTPTRSVHVSPLGLLQFGLAPTLEVGGGTTFQLRARLLQTGLLSHIVVADPDADEELAAGYGAGLGLRHYLGAGGQRGGYLGFMVEWVYTRVEDSEDDYAAYIHQTLVPVGQVGYKWWFGSFTLGVGLEAGATVTLSAKAEPIGDNGCRYTNSCTTDESSSLYGLLNLDLGFGF